jgi:DNA-binding NarL/FixJ family response regulator
VRVVVAEDNLLTLEGIVGLLTRGGVQVLDRVSNVPSLLAAVAATRPDAVLVDIRMPPTQTDEGLEAAQRILTDHPGTAVLVLSQYIEPGYAMRLLEENPEGVGYLLKDRIFDGAVLIDAVRRLTEGETVVDPTIVTRLLRRKRTNDPVAGLSHREREVLALVAEGLSNRAIAARLSITERTVEAHITQTFSKLRLDDDPASHRRVRAVLAYLRSPHRGQG